MLVSLIIGTKNRAAQLTLCLDALLAATRPACEIEIVLVDNGSTDRTPQVIEDFTARSPFPVRHIHCAKPGISAAHNAGIAVARGTWLLFIDDDCYVDERYFANFHAFTRGLHRTRPGGEPFAYGGGQIHFFDPADDRRIASRHFDDVWEISKHSLLAASAVQGANMFFRRKVFETIGGFNERMGAGTRFSGADIEFACRASLAGFVGVQLPTLIVHHDHRHRSDSAEADAKIAGYDYGRGAYYAGLLDKGLVGAWQLWAGACALENNPDPDLRRRLIREFEGAADYLKTLLAERTEPSRPASWRREAIGR